MTGYPWGWGASRTIHVDRGFACPDCHQPVRARKGVVWLEYADGTIRCPACAEAWCKGQP